MAVCQQWETPLQDVVRANFLCLSTSIPLLPHGKFLHCVENTNTVLATTIIGRRRKNKKNNRLRAGGRLCNELEKLIQTETDCLRFDGEHLADYDSRRRFFCDYLEI